MSDKQDFTYDGMAYGIPIGKMGIRMIRQQASIFLLLK